MYLCAVWHAQMEANAGFLRAARAGTLDKVLECLDHDGADINACNPVCVNLIVRCTRCVALLLSGPWYGHHSAMILGCTAPVLAHFWGLLVLFILS